MNPIKKLLMRASSLSATYEKKEAYDKKPPKRATNNENYEERGAGGGCSRQRRRESGDSYDLGNMPTVINLKDKTQANPMYRKALWTAEHLQLVLMSVPVAEEIAIEKHDGTDQLIFLQRGNAEVSFGNSPEELRPLFSAKDGDVITVPDGVYHRVRNTGNTPLKIFTVYAPPHHPYGTEEG